MIKKIVMTILALIFFIILALVILIFVINPNQYKELITSVIKEKTGYELTINGDLKWDIGSGMNISSEGITLFAPNTQTPILTADKMTLDLNLFSLLSKKVAINQISIDSAHINLTPEANPISTKSVTPNGSESQYQSIPPNEKTNSPWDLVFDDIKVTNSKVMLLHDNQLITIDDIQIDLKRKQKVVNYLMTGTFYQKEAHLTYSLDGNIDLSDSKNHQLTINQFSYQLTGFGRLDHLSGKITGSISYQPEKSELNSHNLVIEQGKNVIYGKVSMILRQKPFISGSVNSKSLDVTAFLVDSKTITNQTHSNVSSTNNTKNATTSSVGKSNPFSFLTLFNTKLSINIDKFIADNLTITDLTVNLSNQNGIAQLNELKGKVADGTFQATASIDGQNKVALIQSNAHIQTINLTKLMALFKVNHSISGLLGGDVTIMINSNEFNQIFEHTSGSLNIELTQAQLLEINIDSAIKEAIKKLTTESVSMSQLNQKTIFSQIKMSGKLDKGLFTINALSAYSETLNLSGSGNVNLLNEQLNLDLTIQLLNGWNSQNKIINILKEIPIPLRLVGPYDGIKYQLNLDQSVKKTIQNEAKNALKEQLQQLSDPKGNSKKELTNKLLKGLLNKL